MGLKYRILLVLVLSAMAASAQSLSFGFSNFLGSGMSRDLGLNIGYTQELKKHALNFELEMRSIDWGNQFNAALGFKATYYSKSQWQIGGITNLYVGMAPFQQKSLMAYGASYAPYFQRNTQGRLFYRGSIGFRYNICPGYAEYGQNEQMEFPLRLSVGFNLESRN